VVDEAQHRVKERKRVDGTQVLDHRVTVSAAVRKRMTKVDINSVDDVSPGRETGTTAHALLELDGFDRTSVVLLAYLAMGAFLGLYVVRQWFLVVRKHRTHSRLMRERKAM